MSRLGRSRPRAPLVQRFKVLAAAPTSDTSWLPVTIVPGRRLSAAPPHPVAVAPVYLATTTATVPEQSWRGTAPIWLQRLRQIATPAATTVRSFTTSAASVSDKRAQNSMSVPYRLDLLQYQTLVGPISPLPSSGQVGGNGRPVFSMGVPYRVEITQYQAVVGPIRLADITTSPITWAPHLVTAVYNPLGWGRAVSSGLTPPGPA